MKHNFTKNINSINIYDLSEVGSKSASLGELIKEGSLDENIIPKGFAITASAYKHFINFNGIREKIEQIIFDSNLINPKSRLKASKLIKELYNSAFFPIEIKQEITKEISNLKSTTFAIRPSLISKNIFKTNLISQNSSLYVKSEKNIFQSIKNCFSALYSDRAILNREIQGISQTEVYTSILIQEMVQSDVGESGLAFSAYQKHGLENVIVIKSNFGLGGYTNIKSIEPDEIVIHQPNLKKGIKSIFAKSMGSKESLIMMDNNSRVIKSTPTPMQERFSIGDLEALKIANQIVKIENYYSDKYGRHCRAEIEWAIDGPTGQLKIIQARPKRLQFKKENIHTKINPWLTSQITQPSRRSA